MGRGRNLKGSSKSKKGAKDAKVLVLTSQQGQGDRSGPASTSTTTPNAAGNANFAQLPSEMKNLRACMICSLIKTEEEFKESGCDNCEIHLKLAGRCGAVYDYTSENFEGMVGIIDAKQSWVAKWQCISQYKPGIYAVNVRGEPAAWIQEKVESAGSHYVSRSRDKTTQ